MTTRAEWLEERRKHIGASDAAAILGVDSSKTPLEIWLSKVRPEMLDEPADSDFLEFGVDLEPAIERRYVKATGNKVYHPNPAIIVHPDYPELACTPDALCDSPEPIVVEYKFERWADNFGDEGTDELPDKFIAQTGLQMACTGRQRADVALLHGGPPIRVYRAHRDLELERMLIDRLRAFWADYVVPEKEPPITGDADWSHYLAKKFNRVEGELVKAEDAEVENYVDSIIANQDHMEELKKKLEMQKNFVKAFIADRPGLLLPDGTKVLWSKVKDTVEDVTDWKTIAYTLSDDPLEMMRLLNEHTEKGVVTRKGSRRFTISEPKEKK